MRIEFGQAFSAVNVRCVAGEAGRRTGLAVHGSGILKVSISAFLDASGNVGSGKVKGIERVGGIAGSAVGVRE